MILRKFSHASVALLLAAVLSAQSVEVTSLLGRPLYGLPDTDGAIKAAQEKLAADPKNSALVLALSKAYAAKRDYKQAVATCARGLTVNPKDADLYLEKGHRELGLRKFEAAKADLTRAVELNPKQLQGYYHLGLAYYFMRHFDKAAENFGHALDLAKSPDEVIDCSNWRYVALRRAGQTDAAARVLARITPNVKNTEPHLFFYLQLLHFYQGKLSEAQVLPPKPAGPDDIEGELSFNTINYGVGNWFFYNNEPAKAREHFKEVVKGSAWNSWGFIGSEIELSRNE
jgi:tetratricopeptide (TPR) repeat protein